MTDTLLLILRALLLAASFVGLCAGLRVRFGLDGCVAPYAAASGVICALMLAGMLRLLFPAVCMLYLLGFAGLIYAFPVKRARPNPALLLALCAFVLFLVWRFYFCPLRDADDVSHWGLVARLLLRSDRFPRAGDDIVYFQSYPLGTACFIYYVACATANLEGIYLVAQNFLLGALFMPVFALIRRRRRALLPIACALFFLLFHYFRQMVDLQVDLVLPFFAIGATAILTNRELDLRHMLIAALPGMTAVALVKNSGLFFSALAAALFYRAARERGARHPGRTALAALALPLLAYLAWMLHIRLSFPAALSTKHAVSLTSYARNASAKGLPVIGQIVRLWLRDIFTLRNERAVALIVLPPCAFALLAAARALPAPQRRRVYGDLARALGVYALWYVLILLMYIFSMPTEEALMLASIYRYNGAGLAWLIGAVGMLLFDALQRTDALKRLTRLAACLGALGIAAVIALTAWPGGAGLNRMFFRPTQLTPLRAQLQEARAVCGVEDGARILVFWPDDHPEPEYASFTYYSVKYEYSTDDIAFITGDPTAPGRYYTTRDRDWVPLKDVAGFVAENLDGADLFLILGANEEFEARIAPVLAAYGGDTPIFRAWAGA